MPAGSLSIDGMVWDDSASDYGPGPSAPSEEEWTDEELQINWMMMSIRIEGKVFAGRLSDSIAGCGLSGFGGYGVYRQVRPRGFLDLARRFFTLATFQGVNLWKSGTAF